MTKTIWRGFNINFPNELLPLLNELENAYHKILSSQKYRKYILSLDHSKHKGILIEEMRKEFKPILSTIKNVRPLARYTYSICENIRRLALSMKEAQTVWEIYKSTNFDKDKTWELLLEHKFVYMTKFQFSNIIRQNCKPELPYTPNFILDYSMVSGGGITERISKHQIRLQNNNSFDFILEVHIPKYLQPYWTGNISMPRFQYINQYNPETNQIEKIPSGSISIECSPINANSGDNILGIDLGKINLFTATILNPNTGNIETFVNSKSLNNSQEKLKRLYKEKQSLYAKIKTYENLHLNTDTLTKEYERVRNKITRIKHEQTAQISNEIINLALYGDCATISVEKLSWLNSKGGKWNHSAIQQKIQEYCNLHNIEFVKVSAHNTSKMNPVTNEVGIIKDRNTIFNDDFTDRDVLASINVSYRASNKNVKPKININKNNKNKYTPKRVSKKLTYQQKQKIKQLVNKINSTKTSGLVGSGGYNVVRNGRVIVLPIVSSLVNTKKFIKQQFVSISDRL